MKIAEKILWIDDDSQNIFALNAVLKARDYRCVTACNAAEGIAILQSDEEIGIVLMDMMMPDIYGCEAIAQIRGSEKIPRIPVFAVTAQAIIGDKKRCLSAGAGDYILKPVEVDLLISIVKPYFP